MSRKDAMTSLTEKMTYKEASSYLGVTVSAIQHAIKRGALTPLPRQGLVRYLPARQVQLFKGKPIALSFLTSEEGKVWQDTARQAGSLPAHKTVIPYLTDESLGEEHGKRFGRNFARGVYDEIQKFDPTTREDLARPLAV